MTLNYKSKTLNKCCIIVKKIVLDGCNQGSYTFELLKFHDFPCPFPWPSEFFMTYAKQLFSKYRQINLLFKLFPHIMTHRMRASVYLLELRPVFWLDRYFFKFWSLCLFALRKYIAFPRLSITHTSISWLSRPRKWYHKIP